MRTAGSSLIEVLAAMTVALLLIVGTAELIVVSLAAVRKGSVASGLCQALAAKLESLKSAPFDGPELEPGDYEEDVPGEAGRPAFVRAWIIEDAGDGMKTVRIRVHTRGHPRPVATMTLYLCRDLGFGP